MPMTILKHACLLAAFGVPGLALAAEPAPQADEPAPQAQTLATMETILEHCAKLSPADAEQYRQQAKMLVHGADEETLAKVRKSDEYQQSRDAMLESLAKVDEQSAKKACAQSLPQIK